MEVSGVEGRRWREELKGLDEEGGGGCGRELLHFPHQ